MATPATTSMASARTATPAGSVTGAKPSAAMGRTGTTAPSSAATAVNGECHFETGRCLCRAGSHGTYCNLTCPLGHYGANCAEACSCHDGTCDPLTGACHMEANQRMGVIGAGALLALLLILLLSLLCCCCVCRKKDEARGANQDPAAAKKPPRRLCGRFSRISMKLPRIPLRRQKLPKVVVAHHDLENTLNCSFIEPPSVVEQPSPSWSSRGSFSSFDTTDEGPVYCVPHEESVGDSRDRGTSSSPGEKLVAPGGGEEAGEYTFLKETGSVKAFQADSSEMPLLKSSDSERSSCGSGSASAALYARVARLSKQSKEEEEMAAEPRGGPGKPPSPERTKPRPPDPSTKPKVSWIHGRYNSNQSNSLPAPGRSPGASSHAAQQPRAQPGLGQEEEEPQRDVSLRAQQSGGEGQHAQQGENAEAPQGAWGPRRQSRPHRGAPVPLQAQAEEQGQRGADGEHQRGGAERLQKDGRLPPRAAQRGGSPQPRCRQASALRPSIPTWPPRQPRCWLPS
uniref:Scavenger receptor class F member 2 n=1 Tax=Anas platyrhynchos TaxID=8839 RepID=A0A8B9SXU9_ANAPL